MAWHSNVAVDKGQVADFGEHGDKRLVSALASQDDMRCVSQ